tara:strand:- start:550 stop:687 length:138 start_codon:yes stop_codon:yes gene_type:complete
MEVVKKLFKRQSVSRDTELYMEMILNITLLSMVTAVMIDALYHLL